MSTEILNSLFVNEKKYENKGLNEQERIQIDFQCPG